MRITAAPVVAGYSAAVSFLDAQLGVILDSLDQLRLWENTVVVFTSDHGYHLGEHGGLWHKMTLFEEASRVPLLVAAPNAGHGERTRGIVELIDLYPTLVELCDLPTPDGLEGKSLAPLLHDPAKAWPHAAETVVSRVTGRSAHDTLDPDRLGRSIRTDRWRYTTWPDGRRELYDHNDDPHERNNLADNAAYASIVTEHEELLQHISQTTRTTVPETTSHTLKDFRSNQ